ncbi:MAG: SseB family protein [Nocardioides sp.]
MSTSEPDDRVAEAGAAPDDAPGEGPADAGPGARVADPQALLGELATSIALLPQQAPPEGEETPEGAIALPVIEQDGTKYVPVFTSEEALRAAGADLTTALRIPLVELAANWPTENLWLAVNPANQDGLALPPEVVRALPGFVEAPDAAGQDSAQTGQSDSGQSDSGQSGNG